MEIKWKAQGPLSRLTMINKNIEKYQSQAIELDKTKERNSYVLQIRKELEENLIARDLVANSYPASLAKPELIQILSEERDGRDYPVLRPGGEAVLNAAVDRILSELEKQRKSGSSLYMVDGETGDLIMPLTKAGIYQPPDYVGEDKKVHRPLPIVHPGITSSLALARAEAFKKNQALEKYKDDPVAKKAFEHLVEPQKMVDTALEKLKERGITSTSLNDREPDEEITFGREHVNGVFQSPNLSFDRSSMFAASLLKKLLMLCGSNSEIQVGELEQVDNGKQRWYKLGVSVVKSA